MTRRFATTLALLALGAGTAHARVAVDGRMLEVVDMHLHPGAFGQMAPLGKRFVIESLPEYLRLYAPAVVGRSIDPWAPHIGIRAQTALAGVDHVVLLAVYTQHTTGWFSNEELEGVLDDARNAGWADGLASIDLDDWALHSGERLRALRTYFERGAGPGGGRGFRGIKLAHPHQQARFSEPAHAGLYALAAELGVPILLHTGFSPFPGASTDPAFYDPHGLQATIEMYDGRHGLPRVDFVLSHVGQGDARATRHALELATGHDNVWLELSALGRPLLIDEAGAMVPAGTAPPAQYPAVLEEVRRRGLIARALFASDGPQFPGMVRGYLDKLTRGMQAAGYTTDEIAAVLAGNFHRLFD